MKKRIVSLVVATLGIFSLFPLVSNAALLGDSVLGEGQENVDNYTSIVESKDNPRLRLISSAVGGGWWRRGKNGSRNISEYQHYSRQGHASCENGNGTFNNGPWKNSYQWSKSSVGWTVFGGNRAYYNYR
ncbi:bacteriocin [Erwinia sp. CPCC 100877]|nr:bacteriocin [Erwinia sp. CPCC 100877]